MKFLCVECDEAMRMKEISGPDESGSLAVVYRCSQCGVEVAMLTNAFETQLVSSLGVKISPDGKRENKCPFTSMVNQAVEQRSTTAAASVTKPGTALCWTQEAQNRMARIPEFVRPMAIRSIEQFAAGRGATVIDEHVIDEVVGATFQK